jgi:hypothetical protein
MLFGWLRARSARTEHARGMRTECGVCDSDNVRMIITRALYDRQDLAAV